MRSCVFPLTLLLVSACASPPMRNDAYSAILAEQEGELNLQRSCCIDLEMLPLMRVEEGKTWRFAAGAEVSRISETQVPALRFELSDEAVGKHVEFFSFGEEKGGSLRFDKVAFIRAQYVFLNEAGVALGPPVSPAVCWGDFDFSSSGVWSREAVPANARSVVVAPSLSPPSQVVDTRRYIASPAVAVIADATKSYLRPVMFGYLGEFNVAIAGVGKAERRYCFGGDS